MRWRRSGDTRSPRTKPAPVAFLESWWGRGLRSRASSQGGDHLRGSAQVGTVPGRVQHDHPAAGDVAVDELADLLGGDDVLLALRAGTATPARSLRLSEVNVTRAKALAISGSVWQKLFVAPDPALAGRDCA
jgi:hypothetical protein